MYNSGYWLNRALDTYQLLFLPPLYAWSYLARSLMLPCHTPCVLSGAAKNRDWEAALVLRKNSAAAQPWWIFGIMRCECQPPVIWAGAAQANNISSLVLFVLSRFPGAGYDLNAAVDEFERMLMVGSGLLWYLRMLILLDLVFMPPSRLYGS